MDKDTIKKNILNIPFPLSQEQKDAVLSESKYLRIIAGAGTGKTETLIRRIAYLLLHEEIEPRSIVAFTFTERAAASMKNRIYERVLQLRGEDACARLGEMFVDTIHSFCLRILEDHFGHGNHSVLDENQEMAFMMREGWGLGLGKGGRYADNCRDFLKSINVAYDNLLDRDKLGKEAEDFVKYLERYEGLLEEHRLLTFGKIISLAVEKLKSHLEILESIKYLIVDEYQDINRAQERLIQLVGKSASVFIVGDPRQSIYQWRGSDEKCFEDFLDIFPKSESLVIKENRRSGKSIVRIANYFADTFERAKYERLKPIRGENGVVLRKMCDTNRDEAEWIAEQINILVNEKKVCNFADIAILLRSVTTSAGSFLKVFRKKEYDFPFLVGGKVGLFRRDEAQAIGRLFVWLSDDGFWVENPYNWADRTKGKDLLETALNYWRRVSAKEISSSIIQKLKSWKNNVLDSKFKNFKEIYQESLRILKFLDFDPNKKPYAATIANLGRFNSLLSDFEASIRLGGEKIRWQNALKGLCWYINTHATGSYEEQPSEDIRGVDVVQIMTVHQAKGLEWPVVFIPCLASRRFPSSKTGRRQNWYLPRKLFDVKRYEGSIEDERRLFYVALTRSRDVLCLSSFERINRSVSPTQFWEEMKDEITAAKDEKNLPTVGIKINKESDELQTFTAEEIIIYSKCPYLYRLREIWGYQAGLVPELGYGRSLHHCLRHIADRIKNGDQPEKAVHEIVDEMFHLPYAGGRQRQIMQKAAKDILTKFVKEHLDDMRHIEEVESRLEFPVQKATITGKVDVIIKGGESPILEIRDYKTSDEVTTLDESSFQIRLYSLGLKAIGRPVTKGSVAYLDKAEIKEISIKEKTLEQARQNADVYIKKIIDGEFTGKIGSHCSNCDYCNICRWKNNSK